MSKPAKNNKLSKPATPPAKPSVMPRLRIDYIADYKPRKGKF